MKKTLIILTCILLISAGFMGLDDKPVPIPPSKQRTGDAKAGYEYLVNGDYVRSGLPINVFRLGYTQYDSSLLHRVGLNANIPYDFTAQRAPNGEIIVAPNCLQCHAMAFDGKLV